MLIGLSFSLHSLHFSSLSLHPRATAVSHCTVAAENATVIYNIGAPRVVGFFRSRTDTIKRHSGPRSTPECRSYVPSKSRTIPTASGGFTFLLSTASKQTTRTTILLSTRDTRRTEVIPKSKQNCANSTRTTRPFFSRCFALYTSTHYTDRVMIRPRIQHVHVARVVQCNKKNTL